MKNAIFKEAALVVLSLSLVLVFGCSDNNSLQPYDQTNSSVEKSVTAEPNWITLPQPKFNFLDKGKKGTGFIVTKLVKADKNTKLEIKEEYEAEPKGKVKVAVVVEFKKGTVEEDTYITMIFDIKNGVIKFMPHMIFNKEAKVEIKYSGLDLDGLEKGDLNFLYLAPNGKYEAIDRRKIKVNIEKGEIKMKHNKIPHYSRYGFTRDH